MDIGLQTHQVSVEPLLDKLGIIYDPGKNIRAERRGYWNAGETTGTQMLLIKYYYYFKFI